MNQFFYIFYLASSSKLYQSYYPHRPRHSVAPVCGIKKKLSDLKSCLNTRKGKITMFLAKIDFFWKIPFMFTLYILDLFGFGPVSQSILDLDESAKLLTILLVILLAILLIQQYCWQYFWQYCWQYLWHHWWLFSNIAG